MNTHPAAPLTKENLLHYWKLNMAKELLEDETDINNRIELIKIRGKESQEILRLMRRKEQAK